MMGPLESLDRDLIQQFCDQLSDEQNSARLPHLTDSLQVAEQLLIDSILAAENCIKSKIRCLDCARPLDWRSESANDNEYVFSCQDCPKTPKFLRCDITQSGIRFLKLICTNNIQLVSSALNLILDNSRYINPLSTPSTLENPIDILWQYSEQLTNGFKFGGDSKSLVLADLHEIEGCHQYPVLIICDTKMVPTRYYLHVMHFLIDCQEKQNQFIGEYLLNELTAIANMAIKEGSVLILGPNLQNWVTADMYAKGKHNLKFVIPFDQLILLSNFDDRLNPQQDLKDILKEAVLICDSIGIMFRRTLSRSNDKEDVLQEQLQIYLTSAIWLRLFTETPFEPLHYHFINFRRFLSKFKKTSEHTRMPQQ